MNLFTKLFGSKPVSETQPGDSFLWLCKANHINGIRPSNQEARSTKGYQSIVNVARSLMANGNERQFAGNFMEVQYCVNLWAAHLILEYGNPDEILQEECIDIITRYSTTPLNEMLAKEEAEWIESYKLIQAASSTIDKLHIILQDVMHYYHLRGCQCCFPRFRQMVAIDCTDSGNSFYVLETEGLISEARKYFDVVDIEPNPEISKQIWTCKICKSTYEFGWCDFSISVARSYLKIKKLQTNSTGGPPNTPIPVFMGAVGHTIPIGKFTQVSYEEMATYLKQ